MNEQPQAWQTINVTDRMRQKVTNRHLASQGFSTTLPKRFWKRVKKTKTCWLWTGAKHQFGYGRLGKGGKYAGNVEAHRISWLLNRGKIPKGKHVLHHCDNPCCVRPSHLFIGDQRINVSDMNKKGRGKACVGEGNGLSKLLWKHVKMIRKLRNNGATLKVLAHLYNVSETTVSQIVRMKTWFHKPTEKVIKHHGRV